MEKYIKYLGLFLVFFALLKSSRGQMTITIGSQQEQSTTTSASPYTDEENSRRVQFIYTASEINTQLTNVGITTGVARDISGLAWDIAELTYNANSLSNYTIKMGNTDSTDVEYENEDADQTVLNVLYEYHPTSTGWNPIQFSDNFHWDGVSNIIVEICFYNTTSFDNGKVWLYNTSTSYLRKGRSGSTSQCGSSLGFYGAEAGKPRIQLLFACNPLAISAGSDASICNTNRAHLNGDDPGLNTGTWTVVSGTATFDDASDFDTWATCSQGQNVLRWTILSGNCSYFDDVVITNNTPTTPLAGTDANSCSASFNLDGNNPTYGIGVWTVVSGTGIFQNSGLYNSNVSDLTGNDIGSANVFRWTINNNGCSLSDDVTITYFFSPEASVTSSPLTGCYNTSILTLNGNTVSGATGLWTVESGSGIFANNTLNNTTATSVSYGENVFRWTLTRNNCSSSANLVINNTSPSLSNAGPDQLISASSAILQGNAPIQGTGTWSVTPSAGVSFSNTHDPSTQINGLADNLSYSIVWTISNSSCPDVTDTVMITNVPNLVGFIIQDNLVNNGEFIQTSENDFFIMNGANKTITGGTASTNTYTDVKLRVVGSITFDGEIDNGKFLKTQVVAGKTFTINDSKIYKNHLFENYGTTNINSSSVFENSGNWTNSSTVVASESSVVKFNGSDIQEVTTGSNGLSNAFGNVVVEQTVITPIADNGIELQDNMVLQSASTLTLTKGVVVIKDSDKKLIVNNSASAAVSGNFSQSWIYGTSESRCFRRFLAEVNNEEYVFPVGTATNSNIAVLNNRNLSSGSFYIDSYFKTLPTDINTNFADSLDEDTVHFTSVSETGIWVIKPNGTIAGVYDLKLYYDNFGLNGSLDYLFGIVKRPIGSMDGSSWSIPLSNSELIKLPVSSGYAYRKNISNFSEFGIALGQSNLPIHLVSFNAVCDGNNVRLNWTTAAEINNQFFTIERSEDGVHFNAIAQIQGAGNSNRLVHYSIIDSLNPNNQTYYRISQTDFDGKTETFQPIYKSCANSEFVLSVYPNPFKDFIVVKANPLINCSLQIFNALGSLVFDKKMEFYGESLIDLNDLNPGVYLLKIIDSNSKMYQFKIVKN